MKQMCEKVMLTINQASEKTGLSRHCLTNMIYEGIIPTIKAGNRTYLNYDKLLEYLEGKTQLNNDLKGSLKA